MTGDAEGPAGAGTEHGEEIVVALETSSALGSVAVASDGEVLARSFLDKRGRHAAELVPALASTLEEAGVDRRAVSAVVVGAGPGSFTGVRVAAAMAKGLVRALEVPLYAYSSLAAAAVAEWVLPRWEGRARTRPAHDDGVRWVLFDARADRVYGGCYAVSGGSLEVVAPPAALRVGDILQVSPDPGLRFVGDGAVRHEALLRKAGHRVLPAPAGIPTADGLVRLRTVLGEAGRVHDVAAWEPEYLRGGTPGGAR